MNNSSVNSNCEIVKYLTNCEASTILSLMRMMDTIFSLKIRKFKIYQECDDIPQRSTLERENLVREVVEMLRYFGSNSIAYYFRTFLKKEAGISYHELVYDVVKIISKQLKSETKVPRIATIKDYERILTGILLQKYFKDKTEEEILESIEGSGVDKDAIVNEIKHFCAIGITGGAVIKFVQIVGKKVIKDVVQSAIVCIVAKRVGKETAIKLAEKVFKDMAQKTIAKAVSGVGLVLLAFDILQLSSPASRITIPCVSVIACLRTAEETELDR